MFGVQRRLLYDVLSVHADSLAAGAGSGGTAPSPSKAGVSSPTKARSRRLAPLLEPTCRLALQVLCAQMTAPVSIEAGAGYPWLPGPEALGALLAQACVRAAPDADDPLCAFAEQLCVRLFQLAWRESAPALPGYVEAAAPLADWLVPRRLSDASFLARVLYYTGRLMCGVHLPSALRLQLWGLWERILASDQAFLPLLFPGRCGELLRDPLARLTVLQSLSSPNDDAADERLLMNHLAEQVRLHYSVYSDLSPFSLSLFPAALLRICRHRRAADARGSWKNRRPARRTRDASGSCPRTGRWRRGRPAR